MQYSEMQEYGFNKIIKEYAGYPKCLPLPCHMDHGWNVFSECSKTDLVIDKPLMLVFSKRFETAWKKQSNTPVAVMGCPFIHYKNMHKITIKPDAKGTVVFPSHETLYIKSKYSREELGKKLKNLPSEFQPITICLFWRDYLDSSSEIYRKMGFKVVTAGSRLSNSYDFVKNFYDILSSHKYATSNDIGSYTFYAVDLGIPFFLTGDAPFLLNPGGKDINIAEQSNLDDFKIGRKSKKLFSTGPVKAISKDQKQFVDDEMGTKDCLSPKKMNSILWKYLKQDRFLVWAVLAYWLISLLLRVGLGKVSLVIFNKLKSITGLLGRNNEK